MAHRMLQAQQHVFHYQDFHINKSQLLGRGSYGVVYKAKYDQLPCAAKVLHPTILDPADPGAGRIMDRFQQECGFLESIRHPNIVQYLGMTRDPESRLPVLLMELLDENLTTMLERSQQSLAYCVQVDICHDIALAVAYLHSNDIVHRDLSSNNVLMIAGRRAKVTDFGMSKLAGAAPSMTPLTPCPGTLAYMPPEALREPPRYTKKMDCFSEGVIMIQVCTRLWPEPGPRSQLVPDSRSPTGTIDMPVLETERRKNHIDMINHTHMLRLIAVDCLHYQENDRPSSEELCQRLDDLKESREYRESVQRIQGDVQSNSDQVFLLTQHNHSLQRQMEQLQQQLNQQSLMPPQPPPPSQAQVGGRQLQKRESRPLLQVDHNPHPQRDREMTLNWRGGGRVPLNMFRGVAVVDGNMAYFMNWDGEMCSYNVYERQWSQFPKHLYCNSSLAVINGQLIAIGGCKAPDNKDTYTNKLLSIPGYKEVFPAMPTKKWDTTAVTSKEHLIVAGGAVGKTCAYGLNTVEVMNTKSKPPVWSTVASLPHNYIRASVTICGNQLYMLGGADSSHNGMTKSVLTCSLTSKWRKVGSIWDRVIVDDAWRKVADAPANYSTCAAVNGELLAVGGCDEFNNPSSAIHKYNPTTNSWDLISNMPTARFLSLVAVLPTNEMMVVGGCTGANFRENNTNIIEIANFTQS